MARHIMFKDKHGGNDVEGDERFFLGQFWGVFSFSDTGKQVQKVLV
jgi:hypothetical protein